MKDERKTVQQPGDASPEVPKARRRVSQRKELAVVTLGMVASVTGLGGLLAASPPPSLAVQEEAPAPAETLVEAPVDDAGGATRQEDPVRREAPAAPDAAPADAGPDAATQRPVSPGQGGDDRAAVEEPSVPEPAAPEPRAEQPTEPVFEPVPAPEPAPSAAPPPAAPSWSSSVPQAPATKSRGS